MTFYRWLILNMVVGAARVGRGVEWGGNSQTSAFCFHFVYVETFTLRICWNFYTSLDSYLSMDDGADVFHLQLTDSHCGCLYTYKVYVNIYIFQKFEIYIYFNILKMARTYRYPQCLSLTWRWRSDVLRSGYVWIDDSADVFQKKTCFCLSCFVSVLEIDADYVMNWSQFSIYLYWWSRWLVVIDYVFHVSCLVIN